MKQMIHNWQAVEQLGSTVEQIDNHIKEQATDVIESGKVENAKPIYFHPLLIVFRDTAKMFSDQSDNLSLTMTILNNSNEVFTKQTFLQWIATLEQQDFAYITGVSFKCKTDTGFIYEAIIEWRKSNSEWHIVGYDSTGNNYTNETSSGKITWDNLDGTVLRDGVNKIN